MSRWHVILCSTFNSELWEAWWLDPGGWRCHTFQGLKSGFGPSHGVQPHKVHSGSFLGTFHITISNFTSRKHPLQSFLSWLSFMNIQLICCFAHKTGISWCLLGFFLKLLTSTPLLYGSHPPPPQEPNGLFNGDCIKPSRFKLQPASLSGVW